MRLFIAINLSNTTKDSLIDLRDELKSSSEYGNFSLRENLHVTLAFLDECDTKQAAAAKAAMDSVSFSPFDIRIDRIGRFGGGQDEATWWAGVYVGAALSALNRDLAENLSAAGFSLDRRKFSPHITLGRRVVTGAAPRRIEPFGEVVKKIDLMKSERLSGRLTYTAIYQKHGEIL